MRCTARKLRPVGPGPCFTDLSCEIAKLLFNFTDYTDYGKTKSSQDRGGLFSYFKIAHGHHLPSQ